MEHAETFASDMLGTHTAFLPEEISRVFLQHILKWYRSSDLKQTCYDELGKLCQAYISALSPRVKRINDGIVVDSIVSITDESTLQEKSKFGVFGCLKNILNRFSDMLSDNSMMQQNLKVVNTALELFSDHLYNGQLGEYFWGIDGELYIVTNVSLPTALIGGTATCRMPLSDGTVKEFVEKVGSILDETWKVIKYNTEYDVYVISKIEFPRDTSEKEEISILSRLIKTQSSAILYPSNSWMGKKFVRLFLFVSVISATLLPFVLRRHYVYPDYE